MQALDRQTDRCTAGQTELRTPIAVNIAREHTNAQH